MTIKEILEAFGVNTSLEDITAETGIAFTAGGLCQAVLGIVVFVFVVRFIIGMVKANAASKKGRERPFGEPVPATPGAPCDLCGQPLGAQASRLAGLDLCDACLAGDFGRRLDGRGLQMQELEWFGFPSGGRHVGRARGFARSFALRHGPAVRATFFNRSVEGSLTRSNELPASAELEAADPAFCSAAYIEAEPTPILDALLAHEGLRLAIREHLSYGGGGFVLDGPRVHEKEGFRGSDEQRGRARCCGAVLMHHIEAACAGLSVSADLVQSRSPDLSEILGRRVGREVDELRIRGGVIDDLGDVISLAQGQTSEPLGTLSLRDVTLAPGALTRLREVTPLNSLSLVDVHGLTDLAPFFELRGLLTLRLPWEDLDPDDVERLRQALPGVSLSGL